MSTAACCCAVKVWARTGSPRQAKNISAVAVTMSMTFRVILLPSVFEMLRARAKRRTVTIAFEADRVLKVTWLLMTASSCRSKAGDLAISRWRSRIILLTRPRTEGTQRRQFTSVGCRAAIRPQSKVTRTLRGHVRSDAKDTETAVEARF